MQKSRESSKQRILAVLRTAVNRLEFLTTNDWTLIIDKTTPVTFKKQDVLIQAGKRSKIVYLLVEGELKVTAAGTEVARIGPGGICGEMAFLENTIASATVTAEKEVEAFAIEWEKLADLFELFPHLASRFYRSLALNLSRRLREQIS
ncbi:MAG: cyclic nucleotide-binding domain-containing protein [Acidobacteriales bacterium]|nr:cyclic nucleotide-binding domain-containing protein [Terriglobales bacterium]